MKAMLENYKRKNDMRDKLNKVRWSSFLAVLFFVSTIILGNDSFNLIMTCANIMGFMTT